MLTVEIAKKIFSELLDAKFKTFYDEIKTMTESMQFLSNGFDEMKKELEIIKNDNVNQTKDLNVLKNENKFLKKEISILKQSELEREIEQRSSNIEIVGIPNETSIEDVQTHIFTKIGISCKIEKAYRTNYGKKDQKNIVVRIGSKENRDKIFAKLKENKIRIKASDLNEKFKNTPIFINEDVPFDIKKLFSEVKVLKKELNLQYLWIKNGRVLAKKENLLKTFWIKSLEDINNLN